MKKRIVIIVVVLLILAALGAGGWWLWTTYGQGSDSEDMVGGSGTVEASNVSISAVIAAPIASIDVEEGDEVSQDDLIIRLDEELLQLQLTQAESGVRAAQAALDQAIADGATPAEQDQLRARVEQAEAAQEMATIQLGFASIVAPIDGTITQLSTAVGEVASPGKTLATLADLEDLRVSIFVPETQIAQISIGDNATITSDSSDREFAGEVVFIASEAEFTPSNIETQEQRVKLVYEVRLSVSDAGTTLKPGMPVDVEF